MLMSLPTDLLQISISTILIISTLVLATGVVVGLAAGCCQRPTH